MVSHMKTAEEKLTWALRFIEMDLSQQTEKERLQLQTDIEAFVELGEAWRFVLWGGGRFSREELLMMQREGKDLLGYTGFLSLSTKIKDRAVRRITGNPSNEDIFQARLVWKQPLQSVWGLRLAFSPNGNGFIGLAAEPPATFLFALAQALVTVRFDKLSQCPECQRPYFTTHGRQLFCSKPCTSRAMVRRFRERQRQEKAKRKKAGPRVR